jgi:hypothetical protein
VLALVAVGASVVGCIFVLWPRDQLSFVLSGRRLFDAMDGLALEEAHRRLAFWFDGYLTANEGPIAAMSRAYRAAAVATLLQIGLWAVELAV